MLQTDGVEPREVVKWFSVLMEATLVKNDDKKDWHEQKPYEIFNHLIQEVGELALAVMQEDYERIEEEAADVANVAMMIADRFRPYGGLQATINRGRRYPRT